MSDAFDPKNERSAWTIYSDPKFIRLLSLYNPSGTPGANGYNSPRAAGYDMFFVDFSQGGGNILINAALYLKVVEWMHARTQKPIIVGGPSMGGQVPRLAMLYSIPENNLANGPGVTGKDLAARVKGYLSIDSPHQGASISSTFQQTIYTVSKDSRVNTLAGVTGQENSAIDGWLQLSVPAAHQMLYSHYYPTLGDASTAAHDGFYKFMKALADSGKSLGDPRGYRKDMAKAAIAYSNFNQPMRSLDENAINNVGKLEIVNTNISVGGVPLRLSWNFWAGGAAKDRWGGRHELEPGSVIKDQAWSPYNKKAQKFSFPSVVDGEHYAGTFMPIQSVLDLQGIDPFDPPTRNEKELAAYSPFDAVYYMRDTYNDYARVKDPKSTSPVSVTADDTRYEHIVFDDQCMTSVMRGLRVIEEAPTAKTVTGPIADAGGKMFNLLGAWNASSTFMKVPFGFGSRSGAYFKTYSTTLPATSIRLDLTDGLSKLLEGKFDGDNFNDALVIQGHKFTKDYVFKNEEDSYVATAREITYPEMSQTAKVSVGDFNGDGYDDILTLGNLGQTEILVDYSNWDGSFTLKRQVAADFTKSATMPEVKVVTGDFNNDRYADIVLAGGNDWSNVRVAWSNGDGTFRFQNISSPTFCSLLPSKGAKILVGTFQDPTTMGIAMAYQNWIYVLSFKTGSARLTSSTLGTTNNPFYNWIKDPTATILTADFNADGRSDIALTGGKGWGSIPVALSTGNGHFTVSNFGVGNFGNWAALPNVEISTADPDVDGRADILLTGGAGWSSLPVAFSNGDGSFEIYNEAAPELAARSQMMGIKKVTNRLSIKR